MACFVIVFCDSKAFIVFFFKVIAVEKNPCAVVVLAAQVREVWRDRDVVVIPGDMRHINLTNKADLIVSELLGTVALIY